MASTELSTLARVVEKSFRHPGTAIKRAIEAAKRAQLDDTEEREKLLMFLEDVFDADTETLFRDYLNSDFRYWMRARRDRLAGFSGPYRFGTTPENDCESLYLAVRAVRPRIVVETGVCYGASTACILEALEQNGCGELYSVDLGNVEDEPPSDFFVPAYLHDRWHLVIGDCGRELPRLLRELGEIDMFHHDSLHTYEHMMWEYQTALPFLNPHGALSSHDVITVLELSKPFRPNPFPVFCRERNLRWETANNYGIAAL